jgi:methylmalonyl-CoA/ethylmalonyl-CoA epimerase
MESIGTKAFMQICLVVKDAEKTMKNFMEVFGIDKGTLKQIPAPEVSPTYYRGKQITTKTKYYVFKMGDLTIELTEADNVPSVWKEMYDATGQGLCYLGVMVEDSAKAVKVLEQMGNPCVHHGGTPASNYNVVDCRESLGFMMNVKMQKQ